MAPERFPSPRAWHEPGWTLTEVLLVAALLMGLAIWTTRGEGEAQARQKLQAASQRVVVGLEEARAHALREGQPCGMRLGAAGWQAPQGGTLPTCRVLDPTLEAGVALTHNFNDPVRFSANGLLLDGGTVWLSIPGTPLVKCVVVSLPLGVTRVGRRGSAGDCEAELVL